MLGITFKPSGQQANGQATAPTGKDGLQQAIQMLSLRYPKVTGAKSIVGDPSLLANNGTTRTAGFNPNAAILQAMIRALSGGASMGGDLSGQPSTLQNLGAPSISRSDLTPQFSPVLPGDNGGGSLPSQVSSPSNTNDSGVLRQVNTSHLPSPDWSYR